MSETTTHVSKTTTNINKTRTNSMLIYFKKYVNDCKLRYLFKKNKNNRFRQGK